MILRVLFTGLLFLLSASAQVELSSQLGRTLSALPDDGSIQAARDSLKGDPKNSALIVKLSKAQAARRQYQEAVATCAQGLAVVPNNAEIYLEKGHRELGLRDFKAAQADLQRAAELDPKQLDSFYHLGLAHYFQHDYEQAANAFGHALDLAKSADSLIDCANWRYVALRRAGETTAATKVLALITPSVKNTEPHLYFYLQLLHFYQGKITESQLLPAKPKDADDIEGELSFNTINYGLGNWYLYNNHDSAKAHEHFAAVVKGYAWNSWGFIGSELELSQDNPRTILQGGIVLPLYPEGSPFLKADRVHEPEQFNMSQSVPGRVNSIINIHNPSIELHKVDGSLNTGSAIIVVAGGGHNTLNVGSEGADFVPFFYNYGITTIILRNRLRHDGYKAEVDAVNDALQAIRVVRLHAKEWNIDPNKIGIMGFSAGAELTAAAAVLYDDFDKNYNDGVTSRPDFVGIIYPGPSPFAKNRIAPPIPRNVPPAFIVCAGSGDRVHAIWSMEYFNTMLNLGVPNIEMHIYGNGRHPGDPLPDGSRMSGGLTDRGGIPFGTWQNRYMDWFRDLGFLQKPGIETKAAKDLKDYAPKT